MTAPREDASALVRAQTAIAYAVCTEKYWNNPASDHHDTAPCDVCKEWAKAVLVPLCTLVEQVTTENALLRRDC